MCNKVHLIVHLWVKGNGRLFHVLTIKKYKTNKLFIIKLLDGLRFPTDPRPLSLIVNNYLMYFFLFRPCLFPISKQGYTLKQNPMWKFIDLFRKDFSAVK